MTQDKIRKIHRFYGWILAAILAVLGILLMLSCLDIYLSGPRPYSAEAIALRFQRILIPVVIALVGMIGGIGLNLFLPLEEKRPKGFSSPEDIMLRLRKKTGIPPVQKEIRLRFILKNVTALCFAAFMLYPLIYFLTPGHFSVSELNKDVIKAVLTALVPAAVGLLLCWICRSLINSSFQREASVYKQALADGHKASNENTVLQIQGQHNNLTVIRLVIIAAAICFIAIGIWNGGAADVLKKAIAICTECIGLG